MPKGIPVYGKKIAEFRNSRYMTQPMLAAAAGMSVENVKRIEKFQVAMMGADLLPLIAKALGLTIEQAEKNLLPPASPANAKPARQQKLEAIRQLIRRSGIPLPEIIEDLRKHSVAGVGSLTPSQVEDLKKAFASVAARDAKKKSPPSHERKAG